MRTMIFLICLVSAAVSQAGTQVLYCDGGHLAFTADFSGTSDYYSLANAQIQGAFVRTNLICAGNKSMTGVKCAGFWNDIAAKHLEISFAKQGDQLVMSYKSLSGDLMTTEPWACSIE